MYTFSTNMHESVCTWTDLMDWPHYDATQKQEGKRLPSTWWNLFWSCINHNLHHWSWLSLPLCLVRYVRCTHPIVALFLRSNIHFYITCHTNTPAEVCSWRSHVCYCPLVFATVHCNHLWVELFSMEGGKKRLKVATSLFHNPISFFLSLMFHSARRKRQTSSIQFLIRDFF